MADRPVMNRTSLKSHLMKSARVMFQVNYFKILIP